MPYDPHKHQRHSIRLRGYDYASEGMYFVTICALVRQPWFGTVYDGEVRSNDAGQMIAATLQGLPARFPHAALDTAIVMPDHVHAIFALTNTPPAAQPTTNDLPNGTAAGSLGRIVQAFKSLTTVAYTRSVTLQGWAPFAGKLWQRNYYERVIRDEQELEQVRAYIAANPARWRDDVFHG